MITVSLETQEGRGFSSDLKNKTVHQLSMFHGNGVGSLNPDIVVTRESNPPVQQVNFYDSTRNFKLLIVFCLMNDVIFLFILI